MLTKKLNGCTLEIYDSIDAAPIENYVNFNRLAMLDTGIGSDLDAVMRHWATIQRYCERGEKDNLAKALDNYRQNLAFIVSNVSPEMMCFVSLLHTIDGEVVRDFSDENAKLILKRLSDKGLTPSIAKQVVEYVKKKLKPNLKPTTYN